MNKPLAGIHAPIFAYENGLTGEFVEIESLEQFCNTVLTANQHAHGLRTISQEIKLHGEYLDGLTAYPQWLHTDNGMMLAGYVIDSPSGAITVGTMGMTGVHLRQLSPCLFATDDQAVLARLATLHYSTVFDFDIEQAFDYVNELDEHKPRLIITDKPLQKHGDLLLCTPDQLHGVDDKQFRQRLNEKVKTIQPETWGEPIPLHHQTSQETPYPMDAWQGTLRGAVESIAHHAQVPLAMAGHWVLGALSVIGQRAVNAPMVNGHKPSSLYLILQGESGSGKSFSKDLAFYAIDQHEKRLAQEFNRDMRAWLEETSLLKGKDLKAYLTENPKPINQTSVLSDTTIEPLLDKLIDDGLANVAIVSDEAGLFFNGHTMKGDTAGNAVSNLASVWSNGDVNRTRSRRNANTSPFSHAYNVRITIALAGQGVILEPVFADRLLAEQGFLARALFANPESLQGKREWNNPERMNDDPYNDPRLTDYWQRCSILLDPLEPIDERQDMLLDKDARNFLANYQQSVEQRITTGGALENLRAVASRMAENASRIATLMAYFDFRQYVTVDDLRRAFLLVEYSTFEHLRYTETVNKTSDSQLLLEQIIKHYQQQQQPIGWSYLSRRINPKYLREKETFKALIGELAETHHIRVIKQADGQFIDVNPCLLA